MDRSAVEKYVWRRHVSNRISILGALLYSALGVGAGLMLVLAIRFWPWEGTILPSAREPRVNAIYDGVDDHADRESPPDSAVRQDQEERSLATVGGGTSNFRDGVWAVVMLVYANIRRGSQDEYLREIMGIDESRKEFVSEEVERIVSANTQYGFRLMSEICSRQHEYLTFSSLADEYANRDDLLDAYRDTLIAEFLSKLTAVEADRVVQRAATLSAQAGSRILSSETTSGVDHSALREELDVRCSQFSLR